MALDFYTDINLDGNQLLKSGLEKLATDPSGVDLFTGRIWMNTTSGLIKYYDGTLVRIFATQDYVLARIQELGMIQGSFDATAGLLPTAAALSDGDTVIRKGDYWIISTPGTIAGIQGDDVLDVGDILQFTGSTATNPAHWTGIQRNLNDGLLGNTKTETQTVALVANTPLTVSAATIAAVKDQRICDSAGKVIFIEITKGTNPNQIILLSKRSLTGVEVNLIGPTSL